MSESRWALIWDCGDRCSHGNMCGTIRAINLDTRMAAVEFDHDQHVTVDIHLNELDLICFGVPFIGGD